ncbi:efflux RND transporter periplasmic adaptor subunit [Fulvivirga sedimenti]|uniref:Efflux RND transporter periplasmic adaptor subunit n=1 Tax=Fulvivirga sedimenti TaxID=2879465 RepID=A0A9X1HPV6_9BACT|nr:efflux RND transporter periplasmic adaptor subunit [Fulvivirga sedimenti]MCA6074594.1 efflux RND transporter periplasmic adaptor subunit [Fulvivirga sedimenti]MCA6075771.1 efflux RND transporter periplasmic adaptor subunit [Fulvivirga sedimenti]MCA6076899.1 efflux RND transporter periplasmic adaptor subunit [Fulvivirga sedimenti]
MAKKKSSNRWLYYVIGALVLIVVLLFVGRSQGWIGKAKEIEVEMAKATRQSIVEKVSASGMVQPVVEVKLSPEVSGELIELNVEEGDSVVENFVLAKIRPDNFIAARDQAQAALNQQKANLMSSQASLSRAQATYQRAKQDYDRQKKLYDEKVISESDWELAQQNIIVAENDLKSARQNVQAASFIVKSSQASLEQATENLRRTAVTAPMSGIVSKLNVEQGETVLGTQQFQGTEIMRIADLNKMEVRVDVNENDIIRVAIGDTAVIDVDSYSYLDKEFTGIVTAIANTANDKASADAVTEFEVRIRILNSSYQDLASEGNKFPFRPGMTASVDIITQRKNNILTVPLSSVTTRNPNSIRSRSGKESEEEPENEARQQTSKSEDQEVVFVNEGGVARKRVVKTGISDFDNIEIIEGVSEGEEIVTGPFLVVSKRLEDGDNVTARKSRGNSPVRENTESD